MSTALQTSAFGFTAYIWHEIHRKTWVFDPVRRTIAQQFGLLAYTQSPKIKEIVFAFEISPPPTFFNHANRFAWKKGVIYLYGKIPYQTFAEADEKTALKLMCESYLEAILTIPNLRGMKKIQFDAQKLQEDLKKLFEEKAWV